MVLSRVNVKSASVQAAIGFLSADHVKQMMKNPLNPVAAATTSLCVFV